MAKSTYVNVSRQDLESWLDSVVASSPSYKSWQPVRGTAGIYLIHLSEFVSVKVSTTLTGLDSVKGKGKASTKLSLVSRLFPRMVLNRKSNKQNSFYRTMNWKTTWKKGVDHLVANSYATKSDFYDNIARIEDRDGYKRDKIKAIESVPSWASDSKLVKFHQSLTKGFILWPSQESYIESLIGSSATVIPMYDVERLRRLYVAVRDDMRSGAPVSDDLAFVAEFGKKQVAGQRPSSSEKARIDALLSQYRK